MWCISNCNHFKRPKRLGSRVWITSLSCRTLVRTPTLLVISLQLFIILVHLWHHNFVNCPSLQYPWIQFGLKSDGILCLQFRMWCFSLPFTKKQERLASLGSLSQPYCYHDGSCRQTLPSCHSYCGKIKNAGLMATWACENRNCRVRERALIVYRQGVHVWGAVHSGQSLNFWEHVAGLYSQMFSLAVAIVNWLLRVRHTVSPSAQKDEREMIIFLSP